MNDQVCWVQVQSEWSCAVSTVNPCRYLMATWCYTSADQDGGNKLDFMWIVPQLPNDYGVSHLQDNMIPINLICSESAHFLRNYGVRKVQYHIIWTINRPVGSKGNIKPQYRNPLLWKVFPCHDLFVIKRYIWRKAIIGTVRAKIATVAKIIS